MNKIIVILFLSSLISCNKGLYISEIHSYEVEGNFSISMRICNNSNMQMEYSLLSSREEKGVLSNKFYTIIDDSILVFNLSLSDKDKLYYQEVKDYGYYEASYNIYKLKKNDCLTDSVKIKATQVGFSMVKIICDDKIIAKTSSKSLFYK